MTPSSSSKPHKMKFRINTINEKEFDVITEDGGVASISFIDGEYQTMYYQSRINKDSTDVDGSVWDGLADGKAYIKDWEVVPTRDELIKDALGWLVVPQPDKWEVDDTIFSDVIAN